jgi:hypothetical protein
MVTMRRRKAVTRFSILGVILFGGFMLVGTLLLGHMRPMWMELDYVLPCAGGGLLVGVLLGLMTGRGTADEAGPPSFQ